MGNEARGVAYIFLLENYSNDVPCSSLNVNFPRYSREGSFSGSVTHFDGRIGYPFKPGEAKHHFPNAELPDVADVVYSVSSDDIMSVNWKSSVGTFGEASLRRNISQREGTIHVNESIRTWRDFKSYVSQLDATNIIYRGQKEPYPLQTTFHRTGRKDLVRYVANDVATLHRALSSRTKHFFDLDRPPQLGGLP